jgi:2-polyprenyl-3-methyl-5-hydroxy-6-metoxy-1,4-benzoquinol methylase
MSIEEPSYEKQTIHNPNPIVRFAHRARLKKSRRLVLPFLSGGTTVLDYGCGEGRFLHDLSIELRDATGAIRLLGYDPYMSSKHDDYQVVSDADSIDTASVNILTCLEVCEHLSEDETNTFIDFAHRVLAPGGHLLVTVPIMMGPALLLKEASRSILHRRRPDTSARELVKASFVGTPPSRADDIKNSHRGYDWRVTLSRFSEVFSFEHVGFSPLPYNHWYGQSQALMVFKR